METRRIALIDGSGNAKLVNIVESVEQPGVFGFVALNPDGSSLIGGASGSFTSLDGKTVTVTNGLITNIA